MKNGSQGAEIIIIMEINSSKIDTKMYQIYTYYFNILQLIKNF